MGLTSLLSRNANTRPGVTGPARVDRDIDRLLRRVGPGDIVVIDVLDLDRVTADALVDAGIAGVVNASPSISGRYPNLGPEVLVANNIALIDNAGPERHTVAWSPDGIHFTRAAKIPRVHTGCGPHDPDAFTGRGWGRGISWGVAQHAERGKHLHLVRFEVDGRAVRPGP